MKKQPHSTEPTHLQPTLDAIADEFLIRCRQGERPKIAEYVDQYPEMSDEIKSLLQTIQFVNNFRDESEVNDFGSENRPLQFEPGTTLGNYIINEHLGSGGMGVVFDATHQKLQRRVALKVTEATDLSEEEVARFEREMSVAGRLNSPNIVVTHDAGESDGYHFIAMELVEGADLGKIATACTPLSVGGAAELIRQSAIGLQQAYESGLVHRDIKPSNLMLSNDGVVKILDLGLAKLNSNFDQDEITQSQQIMGTVDYMAAEQCKDSRGVDIRSDIYSLGATFHKLLTGKTPYSGPKMNSTFEKLTALATTDPPSISTIRSDLPIEIVNIVDRMTRRNPDQRFQFPSEVADALTPFSDATDFPLLLNRASGLKVDIAASQTSINRRLRKRLVRSQQETSRANLALTSPIGSSGHVLSASQTNQPISEASRLKMLASLLVALAATAAITLGLIQWFYESGDNNEMVAGDSKKHSTVKREGAASAPNIRAATKPPANNFPTPKSVIAAFDGRAHYSYVFFDNGRYDEVLHATDRLKYEDLRTGYHWRFSMLDGRDALLAACLTVDDQHSLIFYSDGTQTLLHNKTQIELETLATTNISVGNAEAQPADICAAICWSDEERFIFFENGMCTKFDATMTPIETAATENFFPFLKSKTDQISAARADYQTKLAYFYFLDGTCQIVDTIERETIAVVPIKDKTWRVPEKYVGHEAPLVLRTAREEVVEWCFNHGLVELSCQPESEIIRVRQASDFGNHLVPMIGGILNLDADNSHRCLRSLIRLTGKKLKQLVFQSTSDVSDDLIRELNAPTVNSLKFECRISPQQINRIPNRGITELFLSIATDELAQTVTNHFPNLKSLSIDARELSGIGLNSLSSLESLEELNLLQSENLDMKMISDFEIRREDVELHLFPKK